MSDEKTVKYEVVEGFAVEEGATPYEAGQTVELIESVAAPFVEEGKLKIVEEGDDAKAAE